MDLSVLVEAGLGSTDISRVLSISRVTVSLWLNGHTNPHRLIAQRVGELLDTVKLAVEAGDLPVPHRIGRRERAYYIKTVIDRHRAKADA